MLAARLIPGLTLMGQESPMDNDTWESPKKKPPCYLLLIESDKSGLCTELPVIKQEQSGQKTLKGSLQHEGQRIKWKNKKNLEKTRLIKRGIGNF